MLDDLIQLEKEGWKALSTDTASARAFYGQVLREDAMMLFPGGLRIEGSANILESLGSQPWKHFRLEEPSTLRLSEDAALLTYKVSAQREGSAPYVALISSTYVRAARSWKLVFHQHTPA